MEKILEIKNTDWLKGISNQVDVPIDGLFQQLNGIDPFERGGVGLPSTLPDNQTVGTTPRIITPYVLSGAPYQPNIYTHTTSKLYQSLVTSPYTTADVTSEINQGTMSGTINGIGGAIIWQNHYVYVTLTDSNDAYINVNTLGVQAANDALLHHISNVDLDLVPLCIGADGQLYYGGDGYVGVINSLTDPSLNTKSYAIDPGFRVRDLVNDGRYLVVIADNNSPSRTGLATGACKSKIWFWDMDATENSGLNLSQDILWDLNEPYMIGGKFLDNAIYLFAYGGLYVCSIATSPQLIRTFAASPNYSAIGRPFNPYSVSVSKGSLFWVNSENSTFPYIYAYGNPISGQHKIFYQPYQQTEGDFTNTCLAIIGNEIVMGCDQPGLFFFNVGTSRGNGVMKTIDTTLENPCTFDFVKVVLVAPLSSGQTVQCVLNSGGTTFTLTNETKSYNSAKPKQTLKFTRVPTQTNAPDKFEDITVTVNSLGAAVRRVSVYATPLDDSNEDI